jgi:hypothetical protein
VGGEKLLQATQGSKQPTNYPVLRHAVHQTSGTFRRTNPFLRKRLRRYSYLWEVLRGKATSGGMSLMPLSRTSSSRLSGRYYSVLYVAMYEYKSTTNTHLEVTSLELVRGMEGRVWPSVVDCGLTRLGV